MMKNIARAFFAAWYLGGWMVHGYAALRGSRIYEAFGETALSPKFKELWRGLVLPNIRFFALLLAAFELVTGLLLIDSGRRVRVGLLLSIGFNLFLVQLGLAWKAPSAARDFLVNRLPNLLFVLGQLPLLRCHFDRSLRALLLDHLRPARALGVGTAG
jgi:hypothetical protein